MMKKILLLSLAFTLLLSTFSVQASSSYKKMIKKWTRYDEVYRVSDFSARIIWYATPINAMVSQAQEDLYREMYESSESEAAKFANSISQKAKGDAVFFISFYSAEKRFDDWLNPKGYWKIRLRSNGETWDGKVVEKISKITPLEKRLYPHLIPWATGYYISFPVSADKIQSDFSISVYNPEVSSTLKWK